MNIWKILGIDNTKDKDLIKRAYRTKLTNVNPEDDPEGFMQLRQAYEEAVKLADAVDVKEVEDTSVMGSLLTYIKALYKDFSRRIDVSEWKALFDRDEFVSLDFSVDAFDVLMKFLMENFYVPQKVWKCIVEQFDVHERKKELAEIYPEDFIDYMINNSMYDDMINYYLFDGDEACFDEYIEKYYGLDASIRKRDIERQEILIAELKELDAYHPYLDICIIRQKIQKMHEELKEKNTSNELKLCDVFKEQLNELQEETISLYEDFRQDIFVINCCGDVAMLREDFSMAEEYYNESSALSPDSYIVKGKLADLQYNLGNYEKARDMYMELLKINHYDNNVRAGMVRANQGIIEKMKKNIETNPDDIKSHMEMAWSLYQSYRFDEVIETLNIFTPDEEKVCEYNNVKGRSYLCLSLYDKALSCFFEWKNAIERIPEDADDKESMDKKKRLPYVMFLIADCYLKTDRYEEARTYLESALRHEHEEILLSYEACCELEYKTKNYEACIKACESLIERDDRDYIAYSYMAKACFELDYIKETMVACEKAISIYPYVSEPYIQEIKIYLKFGQDDGVKRIIERYRAYGIDSDYIDYYEALLCEKNEEYQKALDILNNIMQRGNEEDSDIEDYGDLYVMAGICCEKLQKYKDALQFYDKALKVNPEHKSVYGRMGIVLKNLGKHGEALEMLNKQIKIKPNAFFLIHRGIIHRFISNNRSALNDFNYALQFEPDNYYCHSRLGLIYEQHRDFNKALEAYSKAIQYAPQEDKTQLAQLYIFKARTYQCLKEYDESKKIYEYYIEEFGLNADMAYDYSVLLERIGLFDEAVRVLRKCIDTMPYDALVQSCIRRLCELYGENGYIDMANETFLLAVSKDDKDVKAYATMADIFRNHGIYDEAQKLYEQAIKLDINNKENYYSELIEVMYAGKTLFKPDVKELVNKAIIDDKELNNPINCIKMARLLRLMKKHKKAFEIIDKGIKSVRCSGCFYERCHEAIYNKGLIYEATKQYDLARICYKEAIKICGHNALYEERLKRIENKR